MIEQRYRSDWLANKI